MKNVSLFTATLLLTIASLFTACQKAVQLTPTPVDKFQPTIPDGNRIIIHFGTSTQSGCMHSFSNCIWIGWGNSLAMDAARPSLSTTNGAEIGELFGANFPLTQDFTFTPDPAAGTSGGPVTIHSGIYPVSETPDGRIVFFDQQLSTGQAFAVSPLINEKNPQDNLGNLHNLAMQAILTTGNRKEMSALAGDETALTKYISTKTEAFLSENGIELQSGEADQIAKTTLASYEAHATWLAKTQLSANDQAIVADLITQAEAMPVTSIRELDAFVKTMTDRETELATTAKLDDAKTVLSALSVMKYSRYYWFWHELSKGNAAAAGKAKWWIADIKGLLTGGIGQAITDSIKAALK